MGERLEEEGKTVINLRKQYFQGKTSTFVGGR
jgi:hypothetical protein